MDPHGDEPLVEHGEPLGKAPVLIMVHGRGAGPQNILDLVPRLGRTGWTYLAPTAAGRSWYPYSFMANRAQNEPGLSSALEMLGDLLQRVLKAGVLPSRIVLLGFSQGACLTAEFAASHPRRYGGVLIFSGGLIGPPGSLEASQGSLKGTPVFLGCSDVDGHVPRVRVEESAALFTKMGATTTCRIYPGIGHLIIDDEIDVARQVMKDVDGLP
ncbi:MAG: dienelactone hydrolase family protein [Vicinamibacterales bacterium]